MKKLLFFLAAACAVTTANAQYFEHTYYPPAPESDEWLNHGMKTVTNTDTGYYVATGIYKYVRSADIYNDRVRYLAVDGSGIPYINKAYDLVDTISERIIHGQGRHMAEYNGGYLIVGQVYNGASSGGTVPGGSDILFMKVNKAGTPLFIKRIDLGSQYDDAMCIKQEPNTNNYYICGYSSKNDSTSSTFVMKVTSAGALTWVRKINFTVPNSPNTFYNKANYLALDSSGNVWCSGFHKEGTIGDKDALVFGVSSTGALLQHHIYDDNNGEEEFHSIRKNAAGDFILGGFHSAAGGQKNMLVVKLTLPNGAITWEGNYPTANGSGYCNSIAYDVIERVNANTLQNEYFATGETDCGINGSNDALVYKLSNTGTPLGHYEYGNTRNDRSVAIDIVNNNATGDGFALFGRYYHSGVSVFYRSYIVKSYFNGVSPCYDSLRTDSLGSRLERFDVDSSYIGKLSVWGMDHVIYDHLDTVICFDSTVVYGSNERALIHSNTPVSSTTVYPNPVDDSKTLHIAIVSGNNNASAEISIMDAVGRVVLRKNTELSEGENTFTVTLPAHLQKGVYFVRIQLPEQTTTHKIIH